MADTDDQGQTLREVLLHRLAWEYGDDIPWELLNSIERVERDVRRWFAETQDPARVEQGAAQAEALELAERVCALFGWTGSRSSSDREKAATQAWMEWAAARPERTGRDAWPDLDITALARRRDEIRAATLARLPIKIKGGESDG